MHRPTHSFFRPASSRHGSAETDSSVLKQHQPGKGVNNEYVSVDDFHKIFDELKNLHPMLPIAALLEETAIKIKAVKEAREMEEKAREEEERQKNSY